jgi:hypothetical protein
MPGMPAGMRRLLRQDRPMHVVFDGLVDEGKTDADEPSWAAVGRMLEETHFRHVQRRAYFVRHIWSVPADDYVRDALPTIAGHPYEAVVRMYGQDWPERRKTRSELVRTMAFSEVEMPQEMALSDALSQVDPSFGEVLLKLMQRHGDNTYRDCSVLLVKAVEGQHLALARILSEDQPARASGHRQSY